MSIFKETFKKFVRKQLRIREAVLGADNSGGSRLDATNVDMSSIGEKDVTVDPAAFYTNTLNRQCTIRMSSGVDLRADNEIVFNKKEFPQALIDEGLAQRYVLQGGTAITFGDTTKEKIEVEENGETKETTKTTYDYKHGTRQGFSHNSGYGSAYGDPLIRAEAENEFGIVPMPGIIDMDVKTKSAYGSLKEAKVNFVCYNLRQLEILELLYMRPGYPVLLEWAWTPYINNEGKRKNLGDDIPLTINECWDHDSTLA